MAVYLVFEFTEKLYNFMNLQINKISKNNFSRYGQLITTQNMLSQEINEETTKSFYDLVDMKFMENIKNVGSIFSKQLKEFSL